MSDFKSKYGPWALVTGASSGIGEAFAEQLAEAGLNLVLAARRVEKLDELGKSLGEKYGVEVRSVKVDLASSDSLDILKAETDALEIGLLVNNAGRDMYGSFLKQDIDDSSDLVYLNSISPMRLTHHFGSKMTERKKGGVLFVASTAAHMPLPYMSNYAATKAYMLTLGESLHFEFKQNNVDVTVLSPGGTDTAITQEMIKEGVDMSKGPPAMSPEDVARVGMENLGKKVTVIAGKGNAIFAWVVKHLFTRQGAVNFGGKFSANIIPNEKL